MSTMFGSARVRRLIAGVVVVVVVLIAAYALLSSNSRAASDQPIPFNHRVMVQAGVQCLYCHTGAMRSPSAVIPSTEMCMSCHSVIAVDNPAVQQLAGYWERQEAIPWVRVNRVPRFVFFAHDVHVVAGGQNCENCHGDVGNMVEFYSVATMDMGWCLRCHNSQPNSAQLRDCVVCHR